MTKQAAAFAYGLGESPQLWVDGVRNTLAVTPANPAGTTNVTDTLEFGRGGRGSIGHFRGRCSFLGLCARRLPAEVLETITRAFKEPQQAYGHGTVNLATDTIMSPVAGPVFTTSTAGAAVIVNVAPASYDPGGLALTCPAASVVSGNGTVTRSGTSLTITPSGVVAGDWVRTDYTISNASGKTSIGRVYVQVTAAPLTNAIVLIQDPTVVGRAVWGTDVGNTDIGGSGNTMCAYIGVAPISGSFNKLTAWFITSSTPGAYSNGTGGTIRCSIQTVDGSNNPTGALIGGSVDHVLSLVSGHWVGSGMTQLQAQFPDLTLSSPAVLTAGQKFAIVFQNVDASPAANYVGLDALYQYAGSAGGMGFNSPHLDPIWDHKKKDGAGAWTSRRTTSGSDQYYTVPIFVLTDTTANNSISQTFMADLDGRIFGGTQVCRQLFTPAVTVMVDRAYIMLARNVVGCTSFRLGITNVAGAYLNGGTAFADTDISSLPVQLLTAPDVEPDEYAGRSVAVTLPAAVTLTGGTQYAVLISTTTASGIHIHACGIGSSWWGGRHSDPFGGSGNLAQFGTTGSFATWTNTDARLPVYLLPPA